ncbi:MAG: O-antigen ligase family protein, partial [Patescibacteria group bacterium]
FSSWLMVKVFTNLKRKFSIFYILLSIFSLGVVSFLLINSPLKLRFMNLNLSDESIVQRESLIRSSISMINDHPIFGVGLNNFLVNLPAYQKAFSPTFYLQPVHNLFLLIASETGIIGLGFSLWFIFATYQRIINQSLIHNSLFIILSSVLVLGMFDHYFLTLQQGQLLLALVFGLCWSKKYEV